MRALIATATMASRIRLRLMITLSWAATAPVSRDKRVRGGVAQREPGRALDHGGEYVTEVMNTEVDATECNQQNDRHRRDDNGCAHCGRGHQAQQVACENARRRWPPKCGRSGSCTYVRPSPSQRASDARDEMPA